LRPIDTLIQASGKSGTGGTPSFKVVHVLIALERIGTDGGVGRQQLSKELRLGEGTIRTLVRRLIALDLIETSRGGMKLTVGGEDLLSRFDEILKTGGFPQTTITVGNVNYAVLVRGVAGKVRRGIEQRDEAIIMGASGATSLVLQDGQLRMPGMDESIDAEIESLIHERMGPQNGDVVIIGSSDDHFLSEVGAKSAALKLLES